MAVSVVIPTIKGREIKLHRLLKQLEDKFEVIVVDNPALTLAEKRNYGLAKATNDLIYFIDDDNEVNVDTLVDLVMVMTYQVDVGIAASMAVCGKMVVDGGAMRYPLFTGFLSGMYVNELVKNVVTSPYDVDDCANAFMVRRQVFRDIGGFDAKNFPMDMDEADLCIRAKRKGWRVVYVPSSRVQHPFVPTVPSFRRRINAYYQGRNRILFQRKHLSVKEFRLFTLVFAPLFVAVYTYFMLICGQVGFISAFWKGVWDGYRNNFDGAERYKETYR